MNEDVLYRRKSKNVTAIKVTRKNIDELCNKYNGELSQYPSETYWFDSCHGVFLVGFNEYLLIHSGEVFRIETENKLESEYEPVEKDSVELQEYKDMLAKPATMVDSVLYDLCEKYCEAYDYDDVHGKDCAAKRIDQYIMRLRGFDLDG